MKYQNKLVKNGNSIGVTIPVRVLEWLQWRAGEPIVLEVNADRTLTIRQPTVDDLRVAAAPGSRVGLLPEAHR